MEAANLWDVVSFCQTTRRYNPEDSQPSASLQVTESEDKQSTIQVNVNRLPTNQATRLLH
jgi:hypothetical protein